MNETFMRKKNLNICLRFDCVHILFRSLVPNEFGAMHQLATSKILMPYCNI